MALVSLLLVPEVSPLTGIKLLPPPAHLFLPAVISTFAPHGRPPPTLYPFGHPYPLSPARFLRLTYRLHSLSVHLWASCLSHPSLGLKLCVTVNPLCFLVVRCFLSLTFLSSPPVLWVDPKSATFGLPPAVWTAPDRIALGSVSIWEVTI